MLVPPHFELFSGDVDEIVDSLVVNLKKGNVNFVVSFVVISLLYAIKQRCQSSGNEPGILERSINGVGFT